MRVKSQTDSRTKLVNLTEQSLDVVSECTKIAQGVLDDSQNHIDLKGLNESQELLVKVVSNLRSLLKS